MTFKEFEKSIKTISSVGNCPVGTTLELLSGKWVSEIIYELQKHDTLRFGKLKKHLGPITNTMLSSCLKALEEAGIVRREQFNEIPPHVEYSLTEAGKAMLPIFYEISKWAFKYRADISCDEK